MPKLPDKMQPIIITTIAKGGTDFGVHSLATAAECPARGHFSAQEKAMRRQLQSEGASVGHRVDSEGAATGTVGHAIMAEVIKHWWNEDPEAVREACLDPAMLVITAEATSQPWTQNADVRLARYAAGFAWSVLRPLLVDAMAPEAEMYFEKVLDVDGTRLTGMVDFAVILGPESCRLLHERFGGRRPKPGLTVFDWKFIKSLSQSESHLDPYQALSYQYLADYDGCGSKEPVANFIFVLVQKATAQTRAPKNDILAVAMELPTAESGHEALVQLKRRGAVKTDAWDVPTTEAYNLNACRNRYGDLCPYAPENAGQCTKGLTFAL